MSKPSQDNLQALFLRVIEIPVEDRSHWLEEHCPDKELQTELAELLQFHGQDSLPIDKGVLDETIDSEFKVPGSGGLHVRCPHCHNPIELVPDAELENIQCPSCGSDFGLISDGMTTKFANQVTEVGHFKLVERVGMGAFGSVWKAHDTKLDRTVAVKIPRKGQFDKKQEKDFLREAQSAAQLNHPGIVPVYEVGRDGDTLFIVSEYVRGLTLSDWLTGQQPTVREAAELCAKIAEALHHAHERGIVHRDLKPGNIMLDADGEPHLMDFGLAKREAGEITMTINGQPLGTPAYMSPEQAQGDAHAADRRSDVYSLGVILFQLLTGELPFRGNSRMLLHQVINDEPPSPHKLNSSVPKDLETVCLKCMEKPASSRYDTAKDVTEELNCWLTGRPINARPISKVQQVCRWSRRNLAIASLAVALFLSSLVTIGSLVVSNISITRQAKAKQNALVKAVTAETAANRSAQEATKERDRTQQILDFQSADFAFKDGDFAESFARLTSASHRKPYWEYGHFFSLLVGEARRHFAPIYRFPIDPRPKFGKIVIPKESHQLHKRVGWLVLAYDDALCVYRLADGNLTAEMPISLQESSPKSLLHSPILTMCVVAPAVPSMQSRIALVTHSEGLVILSVPDLKVIARGPDDLRPRLLRSSLNSSTLVTVTEDTTVEIIDANNGNPLAMHDMEHLNWIQHCSISPDGQKVAVSPYSVEFKPVIWHWKKERLVDCQSQMQKFSFTDDNNLVGSYNNGNLNRYITISADTGRILSKKTFVESDAASYVDFLGWKMGSAFGAALLAPELLNFKLTQDNDDLSSEKVGFITPPEKLLATSLLPQLKKTAGTKFLDLDPTTSALLLTHGSFAEVFVPQREKKRKIGNLKSDRKTSRLKSSKNLPCSFWVSSHRDNTIWTYSSPTLHKYLVDKFNEPKFTSSFNVKPPIHLKGKSKKIIGLTTSADGTRIWAIWEGADAFIRTKQSLSKDLMVTTYEFQKENADIITHSIRKGERSRLKKHKKHFRLALHPSGGVRVIRSFFISKSEKTLIYATEHTAAGYDAHTGALKYQLPELHSFAVSPDQNYIAGASWHSSLPVRVWDVDTGEQIFKSTAEEPVVRMAFGENSGTLAVGWKSGRFEKIEIANGKILKSIATNVAPACMLTDKRFIGFIPRSGPLGDLVLADVNDARPITTLAKSVHVLAVCRSNLKASCLTVTSKYNVDVLSCLSATEATYALKQIDNYLEADWFTLLKKSYAIDRASSK